MNYNPKTIAEAIYAGAHGKTSNELGVVLDNTILFLKQRNLISKSKEIFYHLEKIVDREEKVVRAVAESAEKIPHKLKEELEEILKKRYRAKLIETEYKENTDLIGGIKITVRDEVIDFSFRNKLEKLQAHLIRN